jgi:RNA polymerase sigma-54 factor
VFVVTPQLQLAIRLMSLPLAALADEIRAQAATTPALLLGEVAGAPPQIPTPSDGIAADLLIVREGKAWKSIAGTQGLPALSIDPGADAEAKHAAEVLLRSIEQRSVTLAKLGEALISLQPAWVEAGGTLPTGLSTNRFAELMGVHTTTVNRLVDGKRLQCVHGVYSLDGFLRGTPKKK